ncbi:MAG: NADH-quinone oxidoreductase subunit F [Acidobacteria bacterium]|nr:NADH-quinone oxidoreductase subunit F [Acidobacteriota bacterium]
MTTAPTTDRRPIALDFPRLLTGSGPGYDEHLRTLGPLPDHRGLIEEVERSGLTGRGGAGFPTARKLSAMTPRGVVIANGSEGEPLSAKDEWLLRQRPHLVIDGMLATARATDAKQLHLVVGPASEAAARQAVGERRDARGIEVTVTQERFVSGEASAVVHLLTSGDALPTDHTVRLTTRGLRRKPTLVQNVETLAHIGVIARFGAAAFRSVGHPADPGTRLFSITGDVQHPGVTEAEGGTPLRSVIGVASPRSVAGVLVGGYHGTWVGREALERPLALPTMPGAIPAGAGILMVIGEGTCGVRTTAEIAEYLAAESAGQCGPCVNGLPALAELVARLAHGDRNHGLVGEVERMLTLVDGRGACHHPDGTARIVRSAMRTFAADIEAHRHGHCLAAR